MGLTLFIRLAETVNRILVALLIVLAFLTVDALADSSMLHWLFGMGWW